MPGMKNRVGFLRHVARLVSVYGVFGTLRLVLFELVYGLKFGFATARMVTGDDLAIDERLKEHAAPYLPSPYYFIRQAFARLPATAKVGTFVDIGCGLGRVMLFAAQHPFRKLIGVEVSEPLAAAARASLRRYYRRKGEQAPAWEVMCADATNFRIPAETRVVYLGDPFDATIMTPVVDNIPAAAADGKPVYVVYVHPAHADVLTARGFRVLASEVNAANRGFVIFSKSLPVEFATQDWNQYWQAGSHRGKWLYDLIAAFYRRAIIRPAVNYFLGANFSSGSRVLHAGCGSGMVDVDMAKRMKITALDISPVGLSDYARHHGNDVALLAGSIFNIPCEDESFDGIFNLGVMEHFTIDELACILREFNRVLKTGSRMVLFWPPAWGLSVNVLKAVHFVLHNILKSKIELHPPEYTHVRSRNETEAWLVEAGFELRDFYFGPRDFFTHQIVVAEKVRPLAGTRRRNNESHRA